VRAPLKPFLMLRETLLPYLINRCPSLERISIMKDFAVVACFSLVGLVLSLAVLHFAIV